MKWELCNANKHKITVQGRHIDWLGDLLVAISCQRQECSESAIHLSRETERAKFDKGQSDACKTADKNLRAEPYINL